MSPTPPLRSVNAPGGTPMRNQQKGQDSGDAPESLRDPCTRAMLSATERRDSREEFRTGAEPAPWDPGRELEDRPEQAGSGLGTQAKRSTREPRGSFWERLPPPS